MSPYDRNTLFDLSGHVALVTGGGSGIGLMMAQTLATNGARVYITGRTKEKLDRAVQAHASSLPPNSLVPIVSDVTDKQSIRKLYDEIASKEKKLCILVNNAGISSTKLNLDDAGDDAAALRKVAFDSEDSSMEEWDSTMRTNVAHPFFVTMAFLPLLQASSEAHKNWSAVVVNTASISGSVKISQQHFAYNASKSAVLHLTRMLAFEFAKRIGSKSSDQSVQAGSGKGLRIRVNAISPGLFPSEMTGSDSGDDQKTQLEKGRGEQAPARRPGRDEDMAAAILFAVANQYVNGQNIVVDGGLELAIGR